MPDTPTPCHRDAVRAGCLCPIIDNGRGTRPTPWGFVFNGDCPMHGRGLNDENEETR
jgi:hypothetical protein